MTSASSNLKIYPDYCHSLSPTIGKWCPLRATDVFSLCDVGMFCDGKLLYHHGNHPIKWVRLTGVIVAADEYEGRRVYTLDDSSGMCIECTAVAPPEAKSAIAVAIPKHLDQLNALNRLGASTTTANARTAATTSKTEAKKPADWQPSVREPLIPWEEMDVGAVVKVKGKIGEFREMKQIQVIKMELMKGLDAEVKCWNEVMTFRVEVLSKAWIVSAEEEETCRRVVEEFRRARRGPRETEEVRRRRKESERAEREEKEKRRRKREREAEMRPPPPPPPAKSKIRYPSLAVRKAAAGKYDALGL